MQQPRAARFGSSGIRGGLDTVDTDLALRLGRVLGERHHDVVVARDARLTGPALTQALIAGLLSSGADVHEAGILPTPVLAHAARHHDLGIMVTASHNPAPDNGFKLITPQGTAPLPRETQAIENALNDPPPSRTWDQTGTHHDAPGIASAYIEHALAHLHDQGFEPGSLSEHRLLVDCAHGASGNVTPRLLSRLGARLTVIGGTPDGRFPDRPSEPTAENLDRVRRIMQRDHDHSLGIAHDGDADRTVFIAPGGHVIRAEQLLVVLARRRGDDRLVVPVDAGGLIAKALPEASCVITPVGDIHLSQAILDDRATLGAEPSGTWFIGDWSPAPEGPYAAALVAAQLAHDPEIIQEAIGLPPPARATRKIPLGQTDDADALIQQVAQVLEDQLAPIHVTTIDGARLETKHGWVLVRKSGTEPLVRVTAEADTTDTAEHMVQTCANILHETTRGMMNGRKP